MKKDKQVSSRKRRKVSTVAGSNDAKRRARFPELEFCPTIYQHEGIPRGSGNLLNPVINRHASNIVDQVGLDTSRDLSLLALVARITNINFN